LSAAQIASSRIQNANGARASADSAGVGKSARANTPMIAITTAAIVSMTTDSPSARSTTPSGGAQPPSR